MRYRESNDWEPEDDAHAWDRHNGDPDGDDSAGPYSDEGHEDDLPSDTVECSMCGCDVYEDAEQCPLCGAYVVQRSTIWKNRSLWFKWLALAGCVAVVLSLLMLVC